MTSLANEFENVSAQPVACSVCNQAGVYYVHLYVRGHNEPMRVALHGVTTDSQAAQALETFAKLRAGETEVAVAA